MKSVENLALEIFETGKLIQGRVFRARNLALESIEKKEEIEDLTVNQLQLVLIVKAHEKVSMTELSILLNVSLPSASVMVDRLVEKGLLVRSHSTTDRRKVEITVSENAVAEIKHVEDKLLESFVDLVEKIGLNTAREWLRVLQKIKPVLEAEMTNMKEEKNTAQRNTSWKEKK